MHFFSLLVVGCRLSELFLFYKDLNELSKRELHLYKALEDKLDFVLHAEGVASDVEGREGRISLKMRCTYPSLVFSSIFPPCCAINIFCVRYIYR